MEKCMKMYEATIWPNGNNNKQFKDRVRANDQNEARRILQERHGDRAVPYTPHGVAS